MNTTWFETLVSGLWQMMCQWIVLAVILRVPLTLRNLALTLPLFLATTLPAVLPILPNASPVTHFIVILQYALTLFLVLKSTLRRL